MVGQEAGIPLLFPLSKNKYDDHSSFLSGCYTLGEILESQGYQNRILMGSDANFGCTSNFYKQHGNFKIEDTTSLKEEGRLPQDYHVFWGLKIRRSLNLRRKILMKWLKVSNLSIWNWSRLTPIHQMAMFVKNVNMSMKVNMLMSSVANRDKWKLLYVGVKNKIGMKIQQLLLQVIIKVCRKNSLNI